MSSNDDFLFFFFNDTAATEIYTLSLHDALPISFAVRRRTGCRRAGWQMNELPYVAVFADRSEEHTSELQSRFDLVCRLLLEKKKNIDETYAILEGYNNISQSLGSANTVMEVNVK